MSEKNTLCVVIGCNKPKKRFDLLYCSMHRARLARNGRLTLKSKLEILLSRCIVNPDTYCWEYTKYINKWGYGRLRYNGKKHLAHRLIYEFIIGNIPKNMLVCHHCDNPKCINPYHLFVGTNKDNHTDAIKKGRIDLSKRAKERWIKCPTLRKE